MNFLTLPEFLNILPKDGNVKVAFLLRHAERRHITPEDADLGAHVRITENGKAAAIAAGEKLPKFGTASYVSSPVMRCRETAAAIASARGDAGFAEPENIPAEQSLAEFFVKDYDAYLKCLDEGFYEGICAFTEAGESDAFTNLAEGAEAMLSLIKKHATANFNFVLTHDAWIVPCLKYFCDLRCTPSHWLNFISGIGFVFEGASCKAYPVTFMDNGFLDFWK